MDGEVERMPPHLFPFFHSLSCPSGVRSPLERHFSRCPTSSDGNYKCSWGGQWQHSSDIISRCYCALLLFSVALGAPMYDVRTWGVGVKKNLKFVDS